MQISLAKVKGVNSDGTLSAESFESAEVMTNIEIMTGGWLFWKPAIGDIVVVAKTEQNQQICLGTLHHGHPQWPQLSFNTNETNVKIVQEGHFVSSTPLTAPEYLIGS